MSPSSSGSNFISHSTVSLDVTEPTQVGEARRQAAALIRQLGWNDNDAGKAAIVITELATNLVKHARDGELLMQIVGPEDNPCIELLALDKGPGITDITRALTDGYSTCGSPGTGLGAIVRQSAYFDLFSLPGGTVVLVRLRPSANRSPAEKPARVGAVNVPVASEPVCGDAWALAAHLDGVRVMVADGLGHGPLAATAANEAVRVFRQQTTAEPLAALEAIHAALHSTRGAAAAVAIIDFAARTLRYAGVGNIVAAVVQSAGHQNLVSHNGTLGHEVYKMQEFSYAFPAQAMLVMHSDGLTGRWTLAGYAGLARRDASLIAGVLYRDCKRGRDDATIVVVRQPDAGQP